MTHTELRNLAARTCLNDAHNRTRPETRAQWSSREVMLTNALARVTGCSFDRCRAQIRTAMRKTHAQVQVGAK